MKIKDLRGDMETRSGRPCQMAAYCRLSKDDGENKISESIENQIKMIREYVERTEDLELADIYMDDGYSGLYFANRPEFQRMMDDIYRGKIEGVITKDISRLGREYIETGNYIERIFPSLGIRYIAILDGVDTGCHSNEELAQFKTLFNDMYSRDISKKIRGALAVQKKRGQFVSGFAPYGYVKDPMDKHRFLVDQEAAEIVKRIFTLYLAGYSRDGIAKMLNRERVMTPSEYKRKVQGLNYSNAWEKTGGKGWAYPTVNHILKNRVYTGAMVQHKTEKISYKVEKYRYIPEEQQDIVEGMHEAIIGKDVFERTQKMMKKRTRTSGGGSQIRRVNPYAGILVCGDCGYHLQRVSGRDGYECGCYHRKGNTVCYSHFIKKEVLDSIVINELQRQTGQILEEGDRIALAEAAEQRKVIQKRCQETERQIKRLQKKLADVQKYRKRIYENYVEGILDKEECLAYKEEYKKQEDEIGEKIRQTEQERERSREAGAYQENWIERWIKGGEISEVGREMVTELIEKIVVNGDQSIDLVFAYQNTRYYQM